MNFVPRPPPLKLSTSEHEFELDLGAIGLALA